MKKILLLLFLCSALGAVAQKTDSIYFDLYTDSLKKGVHNYINVVGKMSNGSYLPLMASEVDFSSSAGKWEGNSLIIDSAYKSDSIVVYATLKAAPAVKRSIIIYMKKNLVEGPLKTEKELLEEWQNGSNKKRKTRLNKGL